MQRVINGVAHEQRAVEYSGGQQRTEQQPGMQAPMIGKSA